MRYCRYWLLFLFSFFFAAISIPLYAQVKQVMHEHYPRKYAEDGLLTWDDFRERQGEGSVRSELFYVIEYGTVKTRLHDTVITSMKANAFIDVVRSWVNPEYKSPSLLLYNQVIFNIAMLYAYRMTHAMGNSGSSSYIAASSTFYTQSCNDRVSDFKKQTDNGQNLEQLALYAGRVKEELEAEQRQQKDSLPSPSNFGYALHANAGFGVLTGTLKNYFTSPFDFNFGFEFARKRVMLLLDGTLGGCKTKQAFRYQDNDWKDGQGTLFCIVNLDLGYAVIDNKRIRLTPFAGGGVTEFSYTPPDKKNNASVNMDSYNVTGGLNIDLKTRKYIHLIPGGFNRMGEATFTSLRMRIYASKVNYGSLMSGYTINFGLGINVFGNSLK